MGNRASKIVAVGAMAGGGLLLLLFAMARPEYLTSQTYLAGLLGLECIVAAVWLYKRVFFPVFILTFLLAGMDLPVSSAFMIGRWVILGVGAVIGTVMMLQERRHHLGYFHALALFAVLAATVSAAVSRYKFQSSLKVLSLSLLFLYGATGVRLAVKGRENRFFAGLLTGCEILVAVVAAFYLAGQEVMGNPNSLGVVMGVVAAPILLWGTLLKQEVSTYWRRVFFFVLAMYLTFFSQARAALLSALVACGLLCLVPKKYRLLGLGVGVLAIIAAFTAIVRPDVFANMISASTSAVVYKGKDPNEGILASRSSPWQDTIDSIQQHFWFGTGFGTSDNGNLDSDVRGKFASSSAISAEHGSSYLAILSWVGVLGVLPFVLLLCAVVAKLTQTLRWMLRTREVTHPAVPLAIVVLAALIHAVFEDWMFAPGYYLCAFFWSIVFVLVDLAPPLTVPESSNVSAVRSRLSRADLRAVVSSR